MIHGRYPPGIMIKKLKKVIQAFQKVKCPSFPNTQRWAFFKCMLVDTNTTTNCGVFYEMQIGNIMQFECIKENSYRVQLQCFRSKSAVVACNEAVTKSTPHFGNVPYIWTLALVKHQEKVIINLNIQRSRGFKGGGFLWLLLKCERELTPIHISISSS